MVINVTLRFAPGVNGAVQPVADGAKLQIVSALGICTEVALPPNAGQTIAATGELRVAPVDIPARSTSAAAAAVNPNCPAPGERLTIALALPGGSNLVLLTTIWSPGAADVTLTVPGPQPQSESGEPANPLPPSAQLPGTGTGHATTATGAGIAISVLLLSLSAAFALWSRRLAGGAHRSK